MPAFDQTGVTVAGQMARFADCLQEYLRADGFTSIEVHRSRHDIQNTWDVVRT